MSTIASFYTLDHTWSPDYGQVHTQKLDFDIAVKVVYHVSRFLATG